WSTVYDTLGVMRESRNGFLRGDDADTRLEGVERFHRERTYEVVSWSPATRRAGVAGGSPSQDGFVGAPFAGLAAKSGAARLASADVASLGTNAVVVAAAFAHPDGSVRSPHPGDSLTIVTTSDIASYQCPYAAVHAATYLRALVENTSRGEERN